MKATFCAACISRRVYTVPRQLRAIRFSEEEVERIIEGKLQAPPSREYQQQQIDNMLNAFNIVGKTQLGGASTPFTLELLNSYHAIILDNLDDSLADNVVIGELRTHRVMVGRYLAALPGDCPLLVDKYCDWLNQEMPAPEGYALASQIIKAMVAHIYFAWIHPYGDGNGRMTRLLEFVILLRAGVPDVAAHLLSNFTIRPVTSIIRTCRHPMVNIETVRIQIEATFSISLGMRCKVSRTSWMNSF